MTEQPSQWRRRLAALCDVVTVVLVTQAISTHLFGGFRIGAEPFVISTRSADRMLLEALIVLLLRHVIQPHPSLLDRLTARLAGAPAWLRPVTRGDWLFAAVSFLPITVLFLWPQVASPGSVPDVGDPLFTMWSLAHVAERLADAPWQVLDARIFHPESATFAWSDLSLLPGILAAPWIWVGVPLAVVYGGLMTATFWAACVTMYVLARATGAPKPAAWVGGVLFGFLPYRFAQYSHLAMQGVFLLPMALLCVIRVIEHPLRRRAIVLGCVVAAQVWWSTYLGAFLLVGLASVVAGWRLAGQPVTRAHFTSFTMALGVMLALMTPYLAGYIAAREVVAERPRGEVGYFSARLPDHWSPNVNQAWYGHAAPVDQTAERHLALGAGPWVLAAIGLLAPPTTMTVMAGTGLLVSLDGSLGLNGLTFRLLYDYTPLLRPFRVPARFALVMGLFLTWGATMGMTRLWRSASSRAAKTACLVLMTLAVVEARPRLTLQSLPSAPAAIYAALPADRRALVLELPVRPMAPGQFAVDPWYLYMATFHRHTLINGYSGHFPTWYPSLGLASASLPADTAIEHVLGLHPEFVILHEELFGSDQYREVVAGLDDHPQFTLVKAVTTPRGEDRLYRVTPD